MIAFLGYLAVVICTAAPATGMFCPPRRRRP